MGFDGAERGRLSPACRKAPDVRLRARADGGGGVMLHCDQARVFLGGGSLISAIFQAPRLDPLGAPRGRVGLRGRGQRGIRRGAIAIQADHRIGKAMANAMFDEGGGGTSVQIAGALFPEGIDAFADQAELPAIGVAQLAARQIALAGGGFVDEVEQAGRWEAGRRAKGNGARRSRPR